ncbi:unnamed protein product [Symbiodinium sp. CCMP2592]|nr:unnamed protein product [Symbiodinium sp. CCMP2592]
MEIPQSSVGRLIGVRAKRLRAIQVHAKVHVVVMQHAPKEEMAQVKITGAPRDVDLCKQVVSGIIDGSISSDDVAQLAQCHALDSADREPKLPETSVQVPVLPAGGTRDASTSARGQTEQVLLTRASAVRLPRIRPAGEGRSSFEESKKKYQGGAGHYKKRRG